MKNVNNKRNKKCLYPNHKSIKVIKITIYIVVELAYKVLEYA